MLYGAATGANQDTWTLRFSDEAIDYPRFIGVVSDALAASNNGADIAMPGYGVWDGEVEESVTVTLQADERIVERLLNAVSYAFPDFRFVHVERTQPATQYVDLDVRREQLGAIA